MTRITSNTTLDGLRSKGFECEETPIDVALASGSEKGSSRICNYEGAGESLRYEGRETVSFVASRGVVTSSSASVTWQGPVRLAGSLWLVKGTDHGAGGNFDSFIIEKQLDLPQGQAGDFRPTAYYLQHKAVVDRYGSTSYEYACYIKTGSDSQGRALYGEVFGVCEPVQEAYAEAMERILAGKK